MMSRITNNYKQNENMSENALQLKGELLQYLPPCLVGVVMPYIPPPDWDEVSVPTKTLHLQTGDIFIRGGVHAIVVRETAKSIYYRHIYKAGLPVNGMSEELTVYTRGDPQYITPCPEKRLGKTKAERQMLRRNVDQFTSFEMCFQL